MWQSQMFCKKAFVTLLLFMTFMYMLTSAVVVLMVHRFNLEQSICHESMFFFIYIFYGYNFCYDLVLISSDHNNHNQLLKCFFLNITIKKSSKH